MKGELRDSNSSPMVATVTGESSFHEFRAEAEDAATVARMVAPTPFVPDQLKVWTNPEERDPKKRILDLDGTVAVVTAVWLAGAEIGLGQMASLRAFTIIRGQVAMYALAARALLLNHHHEIVVVETTSIRAIVRGRRAGEEEWQEARWDIERAKTARLLPGSENSAWRTQTQAMLVARATAEACRWVAADAMLGIPAMAEELEAPDGQDPAAIQAASADTMPRGITAAPAAVEPPKPERKRRSTGPRAALPKAPPNPAPEPVPAEPAPSRSKITKAQLTKLHVGLKALGITDRDEALGMLSVWANRRDPDSGALVNLTTTGDLTPDEADSVLDRLEALRKIAAQDQQGEPEPGPPDDEPA